MILLRSKIVLGEHLPHLREAHRLELLVRYVSCTTSRRTPLARSAQSAAGVGRKTKMPVVSFSHSHQIGDVYLDMPRIALCISSAR